MPNENHCHEARHSSRRGTPKHQRGFTLIELMLGVGIFMVGVSGIVTLQLSVRKGRVSANDVSLASNLAASTLDELETRAYDALPASETATYDRQGGTGGSAFFTVRTTVAPDASAAGDLKEAAATVSWSVEGTSHSITMQTKITR